MLLFACGRRIGIEARFAEQPRLTRSMRSAMADLHLDELRIVTPGQEVYPLAERISVHGLLRVTPDWLSSSLDS